MGQDYDSFTPLEKGKGSKGGFRNRQCSCLGCTCGCCCCCCIIIVILILAVAAALLAFFLTFREPTLDINGINEPSGRTAFEMEGTDKAIIRFDLDTQINNPNFYGATLDQINVDIFLQSDPDTRVGYANLTDVEFPANDSRQLIVPLTLEFDRAQDPDFSTLTTVASACLSDPKGPIEIIYNVDIGFSFLTGTDIIPDIRGQRSFDCPIDIDLGQLPEDVVNLVGDIAG